MASNAGSGPGDVFDVRKVRRFIELMNEHELSEIDLRQADQRIRLRRGPEMVTVAGAVPPLTTPRQPPAARPAGEAAPAAGRGRRRCQRAVHPQPDGRHVLRRRQPRLAAVRQGRRSGRPGDDRLHHRSDEGLQRDSGRVFRQDRRGAGHERPERRVRPAAVPRRAQRLSRRSRVASASAVDPPCINEFLSPIAVRSRCGSSAPAASWASRRSPSSAKAIAGPSIWNWRTKRIASARRRRPTAISRSPA